MSVVYEGKNIIGNLVVIRSEDKDGNRGFAFNCQPIIDDETAHALADAIYAELGLGWLPYPENRPSIKDRGDVLCTMCEKDYEEDTWLAILCYAPDKDAFSDEDGTYTSDTPIRVLAISNVQPYQPA